MENELSIDRVVDLLRRIRLIENTINRLSDEIHDLEENQQALITLNSEYAGAKYIYECEKATYDRLTKELNDFVTSKARTLNPAVLIERLGQKWALVEQQKLAKDEMLLAKKRLDNLTQGIKKINEHYGDISATLDQKKSEYRDVVASYNAHISTFIPYTNYTPTLVDQNEIKRVTPFPEPEEVSDESDFI